jgi:putative NIF3 family GTP cyclohydrolase 1 type 2
VLRSRVLDAAPLVLLLFALPASSVGQSPALTAAEVMQRVIAATGATPPIGTVDTLKAGDPNTLVTGIATTFMDTYSVLEQAAATGENLIITHEPTFYNHLDDQSPLAADPVLQQKLAFIREHHLVVWRFHDTWHMRQPDGILAGMVNQFGWKAYQDSANPHRFKLPPSTVGQIAASLQARTGARVIRIVGDPAMSVTEVALLPGAAGADMQIKSLEQDNVQLLVVGESREWETVPYVQDAAAEGRHKALFCLATKSRRKPAWMNAPAGSALFCRGCRSRLSLPVSRFILSRAPLLAGAELWLRFENGRLVIAVICDVMKVEEQMDGKQPANVFGMHRGHYGCSAIWARYWCVGGDVCEHTAGRLVRQTNAMGADRLC